MVDPDDPLKMVIVVRHVAHRHRHPLPAHALHRQADAGPQHDPGHLAREPRVPRQAHGLIVDYIGIGDELREATSAIHARAAAKASPRPICEKPPSPIFLEALDEIRALTCPPAKTTAHGGA